MLEICSPLFSHRIKENIVLIHKKDKQKLKSYRTVSLPPMSGIISERRTFFKCLLFSREQPCFIKPIRFQTRKETLVSTNSQTLPKLWRKEVKNPDVVLKLIQNRVYGNLLNISFNFLNDRKQRVVLNRQLSSWENNQVSLQDKQFLSNFKVRYFNPFFRCSVYLVF